jgi:DNA polymerase I-like protein with 3'-5' exonuclease and polymerase domains
MLELGESSEWKGLDNSVMDLLQTKPKKKTVTKPRSKIPTSIEEALAERLKGLDIEQHKKPWMNTKTFSLVTKEEQLRDWVERTKRNRSKHKTLFGEPEISVPVIAVDTETTGLDVRIVNEQLNVDIAGICLSSDGVEGLYIPVTHPGECIPRPILSQILQEIFDQSLLVFFNAKFDREILRLTMGITFKEFPWFEDVQILNYLNDPKADVGESRFAMSQGGLKASSKNQLGIEQIELDDFVKVRVKLTDPVTGKTSTKLHYAPFNLLPSDIAVWYAAGDAITTWLLWEKNHVQARGMALPIQIDHELVDTLSWMERQRYQVDPAKLQRTIRWHQKTLEKIRLELVALSGIEDFNPGSTPQLAKVLFEDLGFKPYKFSEKTEKPSTDSESLEEIRKQNPGVPFLEKLFEFREYASLHPENLKYDPRDGSARIHLKQTTVAGGRLSANGGNYELDGGCGLNIQAIKAVAGNKFAKARLLLEDLGEIDLDALPEYEESDLDPSFFETKEIPNPDFLEPLPDFSVAEIEAYTELMKNVPKTIKVKTLIKGVKEKLTKNHLITLMGFTYCAVPNCKYCKDKYTVVREKAKADLNEILNIRSLFVAKPGWSFFTTDYCLDPDTRILTSNLEWKKIKDLQIGEELIGFDEHNPGPKGLGRGKGQRRKFQPSTILSHKRVTKDTYEVKIGKTSLVCSGDHMWLVSSKPIPGRGRGKNKEEWESEYRGWFKWVRTKDLQPGQIISKLCDVWECEDSREAGYLAGIYDGEGCVFKAGMVGFAQKPGEVLDSVESSLNRRGFSTTRYGDKNRGCSGLWIIGGRSENLRFLGTIRPKRLLERSRRVWENSSLHKLDFSNTVASVNLLGDRELVSMETSTHTFLAEGFLSHNCNIEMRCAANISKEPKFIYEFMEGSGDFHTLTATLVFKEKFTEEKDKGKKKALRSIAKILNFALLYGGTAFTIYENLKKIDPKNNMKMAQDMVSAYWEGVPVFRSWVDNQCEIAQKDLMTSTATGRIIGFESAMKAEKIYKPKPDEESAYREYRRFQRKSRDLNEFADELEAEGGEIYEIKDARRKATSYQNKASELWFDKSTGVRNGVDYNKFIGKAGRLSMNIPLQGLAGDFMRMALNRIRKWIQTEKLEGVIRVHGSVHDEVDPSVKNEFCPYILPRLSRIMKLRDLHKEYKWDVPIETDTEYGPTWDIEHHLTGDAEHKPMAWTGIPGMEEYIPMEWYDEFHNKLSAMCETEDEESRASLVKGLRKNLHPRSHNAVDLLGSNPEEARHWLIVALQLDEYWRIDEGEDPCTIDEFVEFYGLTIEPPPFGGFLASVPMDIILSEYERRRTPSEIQGSGILESIRERKLQELSLDPQLEAPPIEEPISIPEEVIDPQDLPKSENLQKALSSLQDISYEVYCRKLDSEEYKQEFVQTILDSVPHEEIPSDLPVEPQDPSPSQEIPMIRKKRKVEAFTILRFLDKEDLDQLLKSLGRGDKSVHVAYCGEIYKIRNVATTEIPEGYGYPRRVEKSNETKEMGIEAFSFED